jgi:site-specific DNA recombinase
MYLEQNIGLRGIADHLNSMGVKSLRGNIWSHVSVREVIENEVYAGTFIWGEIRIEDNHPAIIERSAWDEVQRRRRRKKELGGRSQNQLFLLSGLLRCQCGASMVGRTARKGKYTYRYYVCNDYASKGTTTCPGGYFRAEKIESMVMNDIKVFSRQRKPTIKKGMVPADIGILKEQLELKRKELTGLNTMLVRSAEAYERGMYDLDWYSMRKGKIEEEKAALASEIDILEGKIKGELTPEEMGIKVSEKIKLARELLKEKDPLRVKAKLQELIGNIVVRDEDNIIIRYRF